MYNSLQEIFDTAYTKVYAQGKPSKADRPAGDCLYKGPNGLKCAFGHLIPDYLQKLLKENTKASANLDNREIYELFNIKISRGKLATFLNDLQQAHDIAEHIASSESWNSKFTRKMYDLAEEYELDTKVLKR